MINSKRTSKRHWKDRDPVFFHIGGVMYQGLDPRKHPPFPEWSEQDWIARRDGEINDSEYQARCRLRRKLGLKGDDPLPSAELILFPTNRIIRLMRRRVRLEEV
jgi:hypothetical protein